MATVDRPLAATDLSRPKADSAQVPATSARTSGAGLNDSDQFFSNLFASARLARQREADRTRQADQAQQQSDDASAHQESLDRAETRDAARESTLQEASNAKPTRQDRARDAVRRDAKRDTLSKTDAAEPAAQPVPTPPATSPHVAEPKTGSTQSSRTQSTTGETVSASPSQAGPSTSAQASTEAVALPNPGNGIWSPAVASAAPVNPAPASTTAAPSAEGVVPSGTTNAPTGAVTVSAVSPADHVDAAKAAAAKPVTDPKSTDGQTKPAGTTSTFEPVLQAAARTRGQLAARVAAPHAAAEAIKPDEAEGIEKLARVIRTSSKDGQSKMVLRLDPPELGQVRIDARMQDGALTVRMEAQTQAGHDALKGRLSELRGALEQQGIHVQQVDVDLRPPQSQPSQHDQNAWQSPSQQQGTPSHQSQQQGHAGRESQPTDSGTSNAFDHATHESASADPPSAGVIPWYSRQLNLVA